MRAPLKPNARGCALLALALCACSGFSDDEPGSSLSYGPDSTSTPAADAGRPPRAGDAAADDGGHWPTVGDDDAGIDHRMTEDTCPGERIAVGFGVPVRTAASTRGLANDYRSYCGRGEGSGPDGVIAVEALATGTLHLKLHSYAPDTFDAVLYAQAGCGDMSKMFGCSDKGPLADETLQLPVSQGETIYAVVDGRDGSEGPFALLAELTPPVCGDGVQNPGEDCDFGDIEPGDGCDPDCHFEPPTDGSDQCPGEAVTLARGADKILSGHTVGYADRHESGCPGLGGASDRVFALNVLSGGQLTVTLRASFDAMLSVFESCQALASGEGDRNALDAELLCSDQDLEDNGERLTFEVAVSKRYFLLIDGFSASDVGTFELGLSLQ